MRVYGRRYLGVSLRLRAVYRVGKVLGGLVLSGVEDGLAVAVQGRRRLLLLKTGVLERLIAGRAKDIDTMRRRDRRLLLLLLLR